MSRITSGLRRVGAALLGAIRSMWNPEVPRDAAAISYFSLFILFPAVLVLIAIFGSFLGMSEWKAPVIKKIVDLFPGSKNFLEQNLADITAPSPPLFLSCLIVVIWGSTWIFTFVENALNRAWGVTRRRTFWESRIRSIALLVLGGTMLLISAGITLVWSALVSREAAFSQDQIIKTMGKTILLCTGISIAIIVFFFVYKLMPDRKVHWCEALSGAVVATLLWELDWSIFVKLVPVFDSQRVYHTMGAIIALLTWIYTSSLITLFGANFSAKLHSQESPGTAVELEPAAGEYARDKNVRRFPGIRY